MSYVITKEIFGRPEKRIDIARFAGDLARELESHAHPCRVDMPNDAQIISLNAGDELHIHANDWKGYVAVSINAKDVPWNDRPSGHECRTETAHVRPDARPIKQIANDIRRRVIEASQAALMKQRQYAAGRKRERSEIVQMAKELKKAIPSLDIRVNEQERLATIYSSKPYLNATLYHDGRLRIERIDTIRCTDFAGFFHTLKAVACG